MLSVKYFYFFNVFLFFSRIKNFKMMHEFFLCPQGMKEKEIND